MSSGPHACLADQNALQISKYVEREILNHKRLIHPHIVELREVRCNCCFRMHMIFAEGCAFETRCWLYQVFLTPDYLAIAMEYADGGDMFQLVVQQRGLSESDARWYFQQLIIAIDYCHRMVSGAHAS